MTQLELNKKLYEATTEGEIDLNYIEELLKLGADPMGTMTERDLNEHIISDVFCYADEYFSEEKAELIMHIEELMELFFKYGMDISSQSDLYNDDNINPLWSLAFNESITGLKILKSLLDHDIDTNSVEVMADHMLGDMYLWRDDFDEFEDWFYKREVFSIKMIMLAVSYEYILNSSEYLRRCISYDTNSYDLCKFRSWDDFEYHIDMSKCKEKTGYMDSVITITEKSTGKAVWVFEI